jgi:hypothetical protein
MAPMDAARRLIRALSGPRPATSSGPADQFSLFSLPTTAPAEVELQPWPTSSTNTAADLDPLATPSYSSPAATSTGVFEDRTYDYNVDSYGYPHHYSHQLADATGIRCRQRHPSTSVEPGVTSFSLGGSGIGRRMHSRNNSGSTLNTLSSSSSSSSGSDSSGASVTASSSRRRQSKPSTTTTKKKKRHASEDCWRTYWD